MPTASAPLILDATGLRCPVPVLKLEAAIRQNPHQNRFQIICDDPIAKIDIPHYAKEAGFSANLLEENSGRCVFLVTRIKEIHPKGEF